MGDESGFFVFLNFARKKIMRLGTQFQVSGFQSFDLQYECICVYIFIFLFQCLGVRLAERSRFSEGEIQTFMSVDVDRTVNLCNSFHDMWRF